MPRPLSAWEAKASDVERRWKALQPAWSEGKDARQEDIFKRARQGKVPAWVGKSYWSETYEGKTYHFGVGLVSRLRNRELILTSAEDRARAELLEPLGLCRKETTMTKSGRSHSSTICRGTLNGTRIIDWCSAGDDFYALAVTVLTEAEAKQAADEAATKAAPVGNAPTDAAAGRPKAAQVQWVTIPGGTFMMGDGSDRRSVTVKTFQMARNEVTNGEYQACVAALACSAPKDCGEEFKGADQPAVCVDWNQAQDFSRWAGGRLPTEAEWEYAARSGGKERKFPWGDQDPTCARVVVSDCKLGKTAPVCSKPAGNTEQGLCDMAGNAREWLQDWFHGSYEGTPGDGSANEGQSAHGRVLRGGFWGGGAGGALLSIRVAGSPGIRVNILGFRPAR